MGLRAKPGPAQDLRDRDPSGGGRAAKGPKASGGAAARSGREPGAGRRQGPPPGPDLRVLLADLQARLAPHLEALGLELIAAKLAVAGGVPAMRLVIDKLPSAAGAEPAAARPAGSRVTVDDCAALSRRASAILDELDPGEGGPAYSLEVSSPGLDRTLDSEADMRRCDGALAKVKLDLGDRTEVLVGRLATAGPDLRLVADGGELAFGWEQVKRARLVPEL